MDETKGHVCFENAFRVGVHGPIHSASVPRQRMQSMDVLKFVAIFFVLWGACRAVSAFGRLFRQDGISPYLLLSHASLYDDFGLLLCNDG